MRFHPPSATRRQQQSERSRDLGISLLDRELDPLHLSVSQLRNEKRFEAAMKDPELLAEVAWANLDHDPLNGADMQKFITELMAVSPVVIERAKRAHAGG